MKRNTITGIAAAGAAALAITGVVVFQDPSQAPMIMAQGADRLPNQTASDWVTYADHVVVVTVADEEEIPPADVEVERGEGLIGRNLTLQVERVVWSADDVEPVPDTYAYTALGYAFNGDVDQRTPMAMPDRPRLETGHRYIMAIEWQDARCAPGDEPQPGGWYGLGGGSVIPFDDGIIGQGELAGQVRNADARGRSTDPDQNPTDSLEGQMIGQGVGALARELNAATPHADPSGYDTPQDYGPMPEDAVSDDLFPEDIAPSDLVSSGAESEDSTCD